MLPYESKLLFIIIFTLMIVISISIVHFIHKSLLKKSTSFLVFGLEVVLISLLLLEVFLQIINRPTSASDNHIKAGWKSNPDYKYINQIGYRGQQIVYNDSTIVVLLLGDSYVEASDSEFSNMPEQLLEGILQKYNPNYKVFSLGSDGYGTDQEYLALKEYFNLYRADHVVLWQSIRNDIWNNIFPTDGLPKDGRIKPTFCLDSTGRIFGPNYQIGEPVSYLGKIKNVNIKFVLLVNRILHHSNYHPEVCMDEAWEINLPDPYIPFENCEGISSTDRNPFINKSNAYIDKENLANEKSNFTIGLIPASKRLEYGLELTRQLQYKMESVCKTNEALFYILYTSDSIQREHIADEYQICLRQDSLYYLYSEHELITRQRNLNSNFSSLEIPVQSDNNIEGNNESNHSGDVNEKILGKLAQLLIHNQNQTSE